MALSIMLRRVSILVNRRSVHQLITPKCIKSIYQIYITGQGKHQENFAKHFHTENNNAKLYEIDATTYHKVCEKTLQSLCDHFEDLIDNTENFPEADISFGDGVLTVEFGPKHGTYVINRQTPNKQIWLSSPKSGPKRYDFIVHEPPDKGTWIYRHTGESLHKLLQTEISSILKQDAAFFQLPYAKA